MKRPSSTDGNSAKRIKHTPPDDDLFPVGLERNAIDLLHNGTDGTGHLCGRFFMAWQPVRDRLRAILETPSQEHSFDVEFTGLCAEFFDILQLKPQHDVLLALKGAAIEKLPKPSRTCSLPMKLKYAEGVIIKFGKRGGTSQMVNTWRLKELAQPVTEADEWFSTPRITLPSPSPTNINPGSTEGAVLPVVVSTRSPSAVVESDSHGNTANADLAAAEPHPQQRRSSAETSIVAPDPRKQILPLTKKQMRKLKKTQREREGAASTTTPAPPPVAHVPSVEPIRGGPPEQASPSSLLPLPTLSLIAGLFTGTDTYHPLRTLRADTTVHLIAIVTSITPPSLTRRGDLMCNIGIVDPSNASDDMMSSTEGFKINCFTKKYAQWLPQPNIGEVLILRNVKVKSFDFGMNGVGYKDKLQWAVYSPSTGKIGHGDLGNVPESECLADGFGHNLSPFFHPGEREMRYCLQISDWWFDLQKRRREAMGEVHQIGGGSGEIFSLRRSSRLHRLICEVGPDVPPQGYFDCTVEVLYKFLNDSQVLSLYVTDYTANVSMSPVAGSWCPTRLGDLVMKIEVWDGAVHCASDMVEGQFYSIKNVRARLDRGGFVEGKLVEPKILKLEEMDASYDVHLRTLLERRKAWQEANGDGDDTHQFEHRLIKDAEEGKHFNCVVEVLHIVYGGEPSTYIYVTDYTSRPELFSLSVKENWGHNLEGCIVKINLHNGQAERAKSLETGMYYKIKNLRLKNSTMERQFMGQLGSGESLIQMLDPNNLENNDLQELFRRKKKWNEGALDRNRKSSHSSRDCTTIERLQRSAKCPNKFRISARIIDFDPPDLNDAIILHCTNCKKDIANGRRACVDCADVDHEYVRYLYQMYFLLQDDDGQILQVSVNNHCHFFEGLKRTDIRVDLAAFRALKDRLSPILGNLMQIHEDRKNDVATAPDTPTLTLIINSWKVDDQIAYGLWELE